MVTNQIYISFIFGVIFITSLIVLSIKYQNPTPFQEKIFSIILSLAAAGVAAMLPGLVTVELNLTGILIRASGALAVFAIIYFKNPARVGAERKIQTIDSATNRDNDNHIEMNELFEDQNIERKEEETSNGSKAKIKFSNTFQPSGASIKSLVQQYEVLKDIKIIIEWPEDQNIMLKNAEKLLGDAKSFENGDSHFFGFSDQDVEYWLNIQPNITRAWELRSRVENRIQTILSAMGKFMTDSKIFSLKNYITLANFEIHSSVSFYLSHEKLLNRFLPEPWQQWWQNIGLENSQESFASLFNIEGPTTCIYTNSICGDSLDVGIYGPKSRVMQAWKLDCDTDKNDSDIPFFVEYVVPQVEWYLTEKNPEKHMKYDNIASKFISYRKVD